MRSALLIGDDGVSSGVEQLAHLNTNGASNAEPDSHPNGGANKGTIGESVRGTDHRPNRLSKPSPDCESIGGTNGSADYRRAI
jgi:hypothetical protein